MPHSLPQYDLSCLVWCWLALAEYGSDGLVSRDGSHRHAFANQTMQCQTPGTICCVAMHYWQQGAGWARQRPSQKFQLRRVPANGRRGWASQNHSGQEAGKWATREQSSYVFLACYLFSLLCWSPCVLTDWLILIAGFVSTREKVQTGNNSLFF